MAIEQDQVVFVRDFMLYLTERIQHDTEDFEDLQGLNKQELKVLRSLASDNAMMVKRVSKQCPHMSLSSLTRILDKLEDRGAVIRKLNRDDRRSFIVEITDSGQRIVESYNKFIEQSAALMLDNLTPAERLMLVELYSKAWAALEEDHIQV